MSRRRPFRGFREPTQLFAFFEGEAVRVGYVVRRDVKLHEPDGSVRFVKRFYLYGLDHKYRDVAPNMKTAKEIAQGWAS